MNRFEKFARGFVLPLASRSRQVQRSMRSAFGLLLAVLVVTSLTLSGTSAFAQFAGPRPLNLVNGWTGAPFATSLPTVEEVNGIVQFRGAISGGTSAVVFTLPAGLRPATNVYVPVDMCNATNGRLVIPTTGVVTVQAESSFSNAQCFTSLDGASFAPRTSGFTALTLMNGWTNAPFATSNAALQKFAGIVHFKGAIATAGTNAQPFTLPAGFRPATNVYVPVDLCNATNGRLFIQATGVVTVQAETAFSNAQCFTSLDGAWFVAAPSGFNALTPINGWTNAPFSTGKAAAGNAYGIVYFKGAIATAGTNSQPFTLPVQFRPVTTVYVPVDLCNATKGRLWIQPSGVVTVQAEGGVFSNAQCFTSLDGASFVQ
jgi:hypothetical protein